MQEDVVRTFVKKGNKVVVKTDTPNIELDSKDLLYQIDNFEKAIEKNLSDIEEGEKAIATNKRYVELNKAGLKKIEHFKEWAVYLQTSRCKAIVNEQKAEAEKFVRDKYVYDHGLTAEHNKAQMFVQYQRRLATCKEVADEIHPKIMSDLLYKTDFLSNPFNG